MSGDSKKLIASFAALQILVYHCRIPVFRYGTLLSSAERFLTAATYYGVDIFFFISAFSLVSRPVDDHAEFMKNRAVKLLPLFLIALSFGQFLWFIPSIMILYMIIPPLQSICRKKPALSFFLLTAGWAAILYLLLGVIRPEQDLGIFLFRIPAAILGAYAPEAMRRLSKKSSFILGILLFSSGMILMFRYGYTNRLNVPFRGTFYLTGIPAMLGSVLLLDLASVKIKALWASRLISRFGSMTLELYFSQMVLGTAFVNIFFSLTQNRALTNLLVFASVTAAAVIIKKANDRFGRLFGQKPREMKTAG